MVTEKHFKLKIRSLSSYELRYKHYKPPFLTIAFVLPINILQIESFWDYGLLLNAALKHALREAH